MTLIFGYVRMDDPCWVKGARTLRLTCWPCECGGWGHADAVASVRAV